MVEEKVDINGKLTTNRSKKRVIHTSRTRKNELKKTYIEILA